MPAAMLLSQRTPATAPPPAQPAARFRERRLRAAVHPPQRRVCPIRAQQDNSSGSDDAQPQPQQQQQQLPSLLPSLGDGINWYCYTALGLLFLTDFTPVGQWLLSGAGGASAAWRLALLQWCVFVLPSAAWVWRSGWDLRQTFKLHPASPRYYLTCLAAGPALWLLVNLAIAIKTGNTTAFLSAAGTAAASSSDSSPGSLLLGASSAGGVALQQLPQLLLAAAVSPAVAEELLFRGLLLTALQQRLGRTDALALAAGLFAAIHLDPGQFFLYCVLGGAAGVAAAASGSVGPAIVLHLSFNAAAVAAGLVMQAAGPLLPAP